MKCPSCLTALTAPLPQCPVCGLTVERLDTKFGALPRHMQFFTDRSNSLPMRGMNEIRDLLELFNRKFPQSLFSAFVLPELKNGTIAEYTFWLANRGRFNPDDPLGADNFDLLLGVDLHRRAAALLVGYGLENYLTEQDLDNALMQAASEFRVNDIIGGIRSCVTFVTEQLRDIALKIEEERDRQLAQPISETNP